MKIFKRILIGLLFTIFLLLRGSFIYEQVGFGSDSAVQKKISERHDRAVIDYYTIDGHTVRYVDIGNESSPLLILVHGTPGSLTAWNALIRDTNLLDQYRIIAVDRPGFGKSGMSAVVGIEKQARLLAPLLDLNRSEIKPILVGHSFAPPILAKITLMHPEKVGGMIMVAGAMSQAYEITWWLSYPFYTKLTKWLLPPSIRSTVYEKMASDKELASFESERENITHPITIMHGHKDRIVPIGNAFDVEKWASNAQLTMLIDDERGHLIPFTQPELIEQAIYDIRVLLK